MKLLEYIQSRNSVLNRDNILTLKSYENLIKHFIQLNKKYQYLHYSQDFLEKENIADFLSCIKGTIILISSPDIDFPPPKKPYSYDKYADFTKFPENYKEINYNDKIQKELIPIIERNNIKIFVHAASIYSHNVLTVPIGIFPAFKHFDFKTNEKNNLCYANFGLSIDRWFGNPRTKLTELLVNMPFIKCENLVSADLVNRNTMNIDHFYQNISNSKFALCPRGCGIDTYRLWDCICLGCIPIVEKYGGHEHFTDLPILFIDDYSILTEEYLHIVYYEFLKKDFNYQQMTTQYWHNKLLEQNI